MTLTYILHSIDFDIIYVDVLYLLNYKAYNYHILHSASPRCTDSAGTLTRWPWPIFCAPVTLTYFASTFDISSTIRPTTIKPCKVLLLNVLTRQIPWPGDLDLYFGCSDSDICLCCLCWGFTAQSTQWGHIERGQFNLPHVYWAGLVL